MFNTLLAAYAWFKEPRNFLIIAITFISMSITLHAMRNYDADWGITNLTLSCEATIASAALMVLNKGLEKANEQMREMIAALVDLNEQQARTLKGVLLLAEAERDAMIDHQALLSAIKANDERILAVLKARGHE